MPQPIESPTPDDVVRRALALKADMDSSEAAMVATYVRLLVRWNEKMNLVGPTAWEDILEDLVLDSLHLARFVSTLDLPAEPLTIDLGAGAGLPGIPLRIFWRAGRYLLVETRAKRVAFMEQALRNLDLPDTRAIRSRVEDLTLPESGADLVLSRAFRPWPDFLELARPLLTPTGLALVMASGPIPAELPAGWEPAGSMIYPSPSGRRWFWAMSPIMAPS
ncbi:MAG: 16S rRNA (guanine(527)-N(7))-methyltransferase RsmG [Deltaproteobacteria bacterium]|nr:16S rRNA (guanine(527)-N(7))-methyltransferase RsmG [Deltaproteobacteria bacterium]